MTNAALEREQAISDNRDPRGVQWGIFPQKGRALYLIRATKLDEESKVVEDPKYQIPEECVGEWTHPDKAQFAIRQYLKRMWDMSDEQAFKNAKRREEPAVATN